MSREILEITYKNCSVKDSLQNDGGNIVKHVERTLTTNKTTKNVKTEKIYIFAQTTEKQARHSLWR